MPIFAPTITADMAKLVDVPDLGSGAARRVGSSPIIRTEKKLLRNQRLFFLLHFVFFLKANLSVNYLLQITNYCFQLFE